MNEPLNLSKWREIEPADQTISNKIEKKKKSNRVNKWRRNVCNDERD